MKAEKGRLGAVELFLPGKIKSKLSFTRRVHQTTQPQSTKINGVSTPLPQPTMGATVQSMNVFTILVVTAGVLAVLGLIKPQWPLVAVGLLLIAVALLTKGN